jgi:alanine racemase
MTSTGILTIDLTAIAANWTLLAERMAPGVAVGAVIKANAYGLGAARVGRELYSAGAREFFFATKQEALAFKSEELTGIRCYVLGGAAAGDEAEFIEQNLIPVLFSFAAVMRWSAVCMQKGVAAASVIKLNTGMTRLGLDCSQFAELCANGALFKSINPQLLMSHLACADEPAHALNGVQLDAFKRALALVKFQLPELRYSLANSSGIFLGDDWHFDLVRPGAALYGINPTPASQNPMRNVVRLALPILQIRVLEEDATIGYGAAAAMPKGSRLAVVAGGYADGLQRTLGLAPEGILRGHKVQVVGRVSMDSMIFDISHIPVADIGPDDYIEVINDELSIDYLMKKNQTLGYEVLTSLGARFVRRYLEVGHGA